MAETQRLSDEVLMALADGELDAATREEVAEAAGSDGGVAARIAAFRAPREAVQEALASVIAAPVPRRLIRGATRPAGGDVVPFRARPLRGGTVPAMAASVAGVTVLAAGPELVAALETQPSGALQGGVCRSLERPGGGLRGLACKRGEAWQVELAVAASGGTAPASDRAGAAIDAALDAPGTPALLTVEEAALRARRWNPAP